jgi:hypothetical protein
MSKPSEQKTVQAGFLISLIFHGHGGQAPPLLGAFYDALADS